MSDLYIVYKSHEKYSEYHEIIGIFDAEFKAHNRIISLTKAEFNILCEDDPECDPKDWVSIENEILKDLISYNKYLSLDTYNTFYICKKKLNDCE